MVCHQDLEQFHMQEEIKVSGKPAPPPSNVPGHDHGWGGNGEVFNSPIFQRHKLRSTNNECLTQCLSSSWRTQV